MSQLINFYSQVKEVKRLNPGFKTHMIEVPFRMLVCTASGGGKSNFVLNLLYEMTDTFHKIIVITKSAEPLYDLLQERLNAGRVLKDPSQHSQSGLKDKVSIYYNENGVNIPEFEKMENNENGLIIFDDMVLTPDFKIGEIFIRGRKLGYSSIYISQSFFGTPKIIRQNVNYVALGRGINKRDLRLILSEYSISLNLEELEHLYFTLTKKHMHFMLLDLIKHNIRSNIKLIVKEF